MEQCDGGASHRALRRCAAAPTARSAEGRNREQREKRLVRDRIGHDATAVFDHNARACLGKAISAPSMIREETTPTRHVIGLATQRKVRAASSFKATIPPELECPVDKIPVRDERRSTLQRILSASHGHLRHSCD